MKKNRSEKKTTNGIDPAKELRIKIEEVPNADLLFFHISDPLTEIYWSFESEEDLQYGGIDSHNFNNVEVPEELQYLAGMFLSTVNGLLEVAFSKYKISFQKSPVFDWEEMEEEILVIIKKFIAKKREISIKERVRMSINKNGRAVYKKI